MPQPDAFPTPHVPRPAARLCPCPQDTAAISTLRCLKLFLERMGAHHLDGPSMAAMAGRAMQLVRAHSSAGTLGRSPQRPGRGTLSES